MANIFVLCVICLFCMDLISSSPESGCVELSRFEYEYKVLQKLTQLEAADEKILSNFGALTDKLEAENKLLRSKLEEQERHGAYLEETVGKLMNTNTTVGFTVRLHQSPKYDGLQKVVFEDVVSNIGGSYDPNSGVFTAPVHGLYVFSITIFIWDRFVHIDIMKNDQTIAKVHPDGRNGPTYDTASVNAVVELERGDRVYAAHRNGGGTWTHSIHGGNWSIFSGVLIKPHLL